MVFIRLVGRAGAAVLAGAVHAGGGHGAGLHCATDRLHRVYIDADGRDVINVVIQMLRNVVISRVSRVTCDGVAQDGGVLRDVDVLVAAKFDLR